MIHTEEQLDQLSECLLGLPYENDGMILSELDGFVTGLIVCPEMAMPSEWLPVVWGDESVPNFKDADHAETTHKAVMAHYNRIAKSLTPPIVEYEAIFGMDSNSDETLWEPWICGFERAMRLKPDSWKAIVEGGDEEARASVLMILTLNDVYCGNSELGEKAIDELDERAPEMIPDMVATLNSWTKGGSRKSASFSRETTSNVVQFRTSKVGRNEPCPCGSGRKYKKCCGLN